MAAQASSNHGNDHGGGGTAEKGLVKLLVESASGRLLGLHMVGEDAPEIMQVSQNALSCSGTECRRHQPVYHTVGWVGLWRLPRGSS